ncbi:hypothetical protein [Massilia sp. CT11-137]|uniref:hypothetical protein n=1 Tax=Massilia sp. CT11-137 TaxID=3393901 RepID=UPI0039AE9A66
MATWNDIAEIVHGPRGVHEMMLRASDLTSTAGTCLYAAFILRISLEKFGGCRAVVRGGDGLQDGGAKDSDGAWHGHYWVEGITTDGIAFVADVTGDQFGHEPVYFERVAAARARYAPGDDATVATAVRELADSMAGQVQLS